VTRELCFRILHVRGEMSCMLKFQQCILQAQIGNQEEYCAVMSDCAEKLKDCDDDNEFASALKEIMETSNCGQ